LKSLLSSIAADTNRDTNKLRTVSAEKNKTARAPAAGTPHAVRSPQSPRPESNPALTRNPGGLDDLAARFACACREIDSESTNRVTLIRDPLDVQ
jgi:hypothetical protein